MSKNNKSTSDLEYIFKFPVGMEDPINPVISQTYFNETTNYLRIFGVNNKWGSFGVAWDVDDLTDKE